jgi:hypothetical protein
MSPEQLILLFHAQKCRMGLAMAAKIIAQAQKTLLPDPELTTIRCELLQHDLALLELVQAHIALLEQRLTSLLARTPYQVWTKFKGISAVQAASLAAPHSGWSTQRTDPAAGKKGCFTIFVAVGHTRPITKTHWKRYRARQGYRLNPRTRFPVIKKVKLGKIRPLHAHDHFLIDCIGC